MELKQNLADYNANTNIVLIVPYGIETFNPLGSYSFPLVLIVPYGIETRWAVKGFSFKVVLIVPYGIETMIDEVLEGTDPLC